MKLFTLFMILISFNLFAREFLEDSPDFIKLKNKVTASCDARKEVLKAAKLNSKQQRKCKKEFGNIITDRLNLGQYETLTEDIKSDMEKLVQKCTKVCSRYLPVEASILSSEDKQKLKIGECNSYKADIMQLMRQNGSTAKCKKAMADIEAYITQLNSTSSDENLCLSAKKSCASSFDEPRESLTEVSTCKRLAGISPGDADKCAKSEKLSSEFSDIQSELSRLKSEIEYKRIIKTFKRVSCDEKSRTNGFAKSKCRKQKDYVKCCNDFKRNNIRYAKRKIKRVKSLTARLVKASAEINEIARDQRICLGCGVSEQNQSFKVADPTGLLKILNSRLEENYQELPKEYSHYEKYYFNRQKEIREQFCKGVRDGEGFLSPKTAEDVAKCIRFNSKVYASYKGEYSALLKSQLFMSDRSLDGSREKTQEEKEKRDLLVEKFKDSKGFEACIKPLDVVTDDDEKRFHNMTHLASELDMEENIKVDFIKYVLSDNGGPKVPGCNNLKNKIETFFDNKSSDEFAKIVNNEKNFKLITDFTEQLTKECKLD